MQVDAVNQVLTEIGAGDVPQLMVLNKIDKTSLSASVECNDEGCAQRVSLSSLTGVGIDALIHQLQQILQSERIHGWLHLNADMGALRSSLYTEKAVVDEQINTDGSLLLELDLNRYRWQQLSKRHKIDTAALNEASEQLARMA